MFLSLIHKMKERLLVNHKHIYMTASANMSKLLNIPTKILHFTQTETYCEAYQDGVNCQSRWFKLATQSEGC